MPIFGDILDITGIGIGLFLFGWLGLISLIEFIPFFDYFPFFILTWLIWYFLRKQNEKERIQRLKDKWK
jgi:hypothetical protein